MTNSDLQILLDNYELDRPEITFLRHNENRTYRVDEAGGNSYLLRIHQPLKDSMIGLQHSYQGLIGELQMLEALAQDGRLTVQKPLRNRAGELITGIEHEGERLNCSMLTWLEGRDLNKEDVSDSTRVRALGTQLARLHSFYRQYQAAGIEHRPSQGIEYNLWMVNTIEQGLPLGLFSESDVSTIEKCITHINSRLEEIGMTSDVWGLIHGDLGFGNVIATPEGNMSFIDFGFFGSGYYLLDVAMAVSMLPAEQRDIFIESYYGHSHVSENDLILIEGFILLSIIGYYAFQMGNDSVHNWMRDRMPKLCSNYCLPYLAGERIIYTI